MIARSQRSTKFYAGIQMCRSSSYRWIATAIIAVGVIAGWNLWVRIPGFGKANESIPRTENDVVAEYRIREFCGACHMFPQPAELPRASWAEEIDKAYRRYRASGRHDLDAPTQSVVTDYFCRLAPQFQVISDAPNSTASPLQFQAQTVQLPKAYEMATVSYLNTGRQRRTQAGLMSELLLCDMGSGEVHQFAWNRGVTLDSKLTTLKHPDHILRCDFDLDGSDDYLIADLGSFHPSDEMHGSVILLCGSGDSDHFQTITVSDGLGRVADAQIADLDGDGDNDFVIAEFGFEKAGRLLWLETESLTRDRLKTKLHVIDTRHGAIHAPVTDFDGDGDLDVIALFGQEHETIVAFMNDGNAGFERQTLFEAGRPSFGCSGMEIVDLDGDGDRDILFTNGDSLDTFQVRPFHGVNWLENTGSGEFADHQLTALPGAVRAVSGDLDNDGDMDIVAVAFCPAELRHQVRPGVVDTAIWLEQTGDGHFERHLLGRSEVGHMAVVAGDFDGDNDLDIAVGEFAPYSNAPRRWLTIYWNQIAAK